MTASTQAEQEAVGANYDAAMLLEVRERTWRVIGEIAAAIRPGMTEAQGVETARGLLAEAGMQRGWHGVYVRFGANTLANYGQASDPELVLGENDIFFIDIGPVWEK